MKCFTFFKVLIDFTCYTAYLSYPITYKVLVSVQLNDDVRPVNIYSYTCGMITELRDFRRDTMIRDLKQTVH